MFLQCFGKPSRSIPHKVGYKHSESTLPPASRYDLQKDSLPVSLPETDMIGATAVIKKRCDRILRSSKGLKRSYSLVNARKQSTNTLDGGKFRYTHSSDDLSECKNFVITAALGDERKKSKCKSWSEGGVSTDSVIAKLQEYPSSVRAHRPEFCDTKVATLDNPFSTLALSKYPDFLTPYNADHLSPNIYELPEYESQAYLAKSFDKASKRSFKKKSSSRTFDPKSVKRMPFKTAGELFVITSVLPSRQCPTAEQTENLSPSIKTSCTEPTEKIKSTVPVGLSNESSSLVHNSENHASNQNYLGLECSNDSAQSPFTLNSGKTLHYDLEKSTYNRSISPAGITNDSSANESSIDLPSRLASSRSFIDFDLSRKCLTPSDVNVLEMGFTSSDSQDLAAAELQVNTSGFQNLMSKFKSLSKETPFSATQKEINKKKNNKKIDRKVKKKTEEEGEESANSKRKDDIEKKGSKLMDAFRRHFKKFPEKPETSGGSNDINVETLNDRPVTSSVSETKEIRVMEDEGTIATSENLASPMFTREDLDVCSSSMEDGATSDNRSFTTRQSEGPSSGILRSTASTDGSVRGVSSSEDRLLAETKSEDQPLSRTSSEYQAFEDLDMISSEDRSEGRAIAKDQSFGKSLIDEQPLERSSLAVDQSFVKSLMEDQPFGKTITDDEEFKGITTEEQTFGITLTEDQPFGRTITENLPFVTSLPEGQLFRRSLNEDQYLARTMSEEQQFAETFNEDQSLGRIQTEDQTFFRTSKEDQQLEKELIEELSFFQTASFYPGRTTVPKVEKTDIAVSASFDENLLQKKGSKTGTKDNIQPSKSLKIVDLPQEKLTLKERLEMARYPPNVFSDAELEKLGLKKVKIPKKRKNVSETPKMQQQESPTEAAAAAAAVPPPPPPVGGRRFRTAVQENLVQLLRFQVAEGLVERECNACFDSKKNCCCCADCGLCCHCVCPAVCAANLATQRRALSRTEMNVLGRLGQCQQCDWPLCSQALLAFLTFSNTVDEDELLQQHMNQCWNDVVFLICNNGLRNNVREEDGERKETERLVSDRLPDKLIEDILRKLEQ